METAIIISAVANAALAMFALWSILETRRLISHQLRPAILFTIESLQTGSGLDCLVMKNVGGGPAYRVRATAIPRNHSPETNGTLAKIKKCINHEWPVLNAGQQVSWVLEKDDLYKDRKHKNGILIEARFASRMNGSKFTTSMSDISPAWEDGQLLDPPGVLREARAHVRELSKEIRGIGDELRRLNDRDSV